MEGDSIVKGELNVNTGVKGQMQETNIDRSAPVIIEVENYGTAILLVLLV